MGIDPVRACGNRCARWERVTMRDDSYGPMPICGKRKATVTRSTQIRREKNDSRSAVTKPRFSRSAWAGTGGAQERSGSGSAVLTERNGSSETFFDVTIDTFESLPVRVTPVGVPGALRRSRDGSSADSGRGCLGWITVHLGAGTSVLATDRHHRWDVRTDRTHGASAPVIPIFGSGERLRLRIESRPSR